MFVCQDAEGLPVEVKMRSKGDGLYSCSYTPTSPLKHTVAVSWAGVSIPKSPFRVSSQSQNPVTTGNDNSEHLAIAESIKVVQSEHLIKTERVEVVQSELKVKSTDESCKTKRPLIIITTSIEERYTS